ncbi:NADH-ubiquinone oxidoreductase-F iron-sulfur binding region domain-containing protein [Pseudarthrobacter sp. H3Y2-7]|uniref:NADH-ubiquinone oxidoreductase-F iron-sulfur binding region domain-containing protein n=1 Tax=Pseudarthrobacter naphthalenicus TaxID=3031328 RepID=UPI0023B07A32|nr:NADH-ubiquinone oxidoreductase-F iron-sulfur binding region domain-containing protein [Pseudarthrobacter sp. H3Y2-7]MDE8667416.1 NADH-ubiquinone oxidoreductase-F iron-sulfur binding region domain-containing protein [Pseudarthrobacter sp. H3Y2-7]
MNAHPDVVAQPVPPAAVQLSRLLAAAPDPSLNRHLETFGSLDFGADTEGFLQELEASKLTGRGGAAFETWRKAMAAARSGRKGLFPARPVVIANGAEGEPLSFKDRTLLAYAPHLVIDGLLALTRALGGTQMYLYVPAGSIPGVRHAIAEHPGAARIETVAAPATFIAGEASAVVNRIATGSALPVDQRRRLSEAGLNGRPTLVINVETLAQVALIGRYGARWFREAGTSSDPGTRLVSVSGPPPVQDVVLEVPGGASLVDVLAAAGMEPASVSAVLVGGYHGRWIRPGPYQLSPGGPAGQTVRPGAGVVHALGLGTCGVQVTARILAYLAGESARQCGPCMFGLPAMASVLNRIAAGERNPRLPGELDRLAKLVAGRGACRHPDGTAGLVASALEVFDEDVRAHLGGRCLAAGGRPA